MLPGQQDSENSRDVYFADAGNLIIDKEKASIGMLQRMFKIGFNRAARIMDQLCEAGVVGPEEGTKPRKVLMTKEEFAERIKFYGDHFWLMFDADKLISFVDGFVTDQPDLTDEMYENASMHNEKGAWQMIFGVNTIPSYRQHGYAGELIRKAILDAKSHGRKGLVLTCKDKLIHYYASFGFVDEGISESVHGNVVWHQMRLTF